MSLQYQTKNRYHIDLSKYRTKLLTGLSLFLMFLCIFLISAPAWSIESLPLESTKEGALLDLEQRSSSLTSSSVSNLTGDSCSFLLKSDRYIRSSAIKIDRNHRFSGQATALGLILGIRFALGSKTNSKKIAKRSTRKSPLSLADFHLDFWQAQDENSAQALAISDYRHCQSRKALEAISNWRWKR